MKNNLRLPHFTHLVKGREIRLDWLSSISINDYQTARPLDWHAHDEMEVIFPVRGVFHYEFDGDVTAFLNNNSFLSIPAGRRHRLREAIDAPGNRFSLHLKSPTQRIRSGALLPAEYARLYQDLLSRRCARCALSPLQKTAVQSLWKLVNRPQALLSGDDAVRARILVCQLLCESHTSAFRATPKSMEEIVVSAKRWLEENAADDITLDDLVNYIGYSRTWFFSFFKNQTGVTPGAYLRNCRLERAKSLLSRSSRTIAEVAASCGLGDPAHFCRLFRKMTGLTPNAYRAMVRSGFENTGGRASTVP